MFNCGLCKDNKLRSLVVFEPDVSVVRIKEYCYNIGWIEISDLVLLS